MTISAPEPDKPPTKIKNWWKKHEETLSIWTAATILIIILTFLTYLIIKHLL